MKTTNIIAILATIIGLLAFSSQNLSAQTYDAQKAIDYANKYSSNCKKPENMSKVKSCIEKWNTNYKGSTLFDGSHIQWATHCISFVSEALHEAGIAFEDQPKYNYDSTRYSYSKWYWHNNAGQGKSHGKDSAYAWRGVPEFINRIYVNKRWSEFGFTKDSGLEDPKNAKAGDILFERKSRYNSFRHAMMIVSNPNVGDKYTKLKITAHSNDVLKKEITLENKSVKFRVLHFRKHVKRVGSDSSSTEESSSNTGDSTVKYDNSPTYQNLEKLRFNRWSAFTLNGREDHSVGIYNSYWNIKKTIAKFFKLPIQNRNTRVYLYLYSVNTKGYLTIYHKDDHRNRIEDGRNMMYYGPNNSLVFLTLKKGVEYYIEATTEKATNNAKMYLYFSKY